MLNAGRFQLIPLKQTKLKRIGLHSTRTNSYFSQRSSIQLPLSANNSQIMCDLDLDDSVDSMFSNTKDEISSISKEQKLANSINFELSEMLVAFKKCNTLEIKCHGLEDQITEMRFDLEAIVDRIGSAERE